MTHPGDTLLHTLEVLLSQGIGFALHRLPWTDTCRLTLQLEGQPLQPADIPALSTQRGFVMAPFAPGEGVPLVCIRPDLVATGWEEMEQALEKSGLIAKTISAVTQTFAEGTTGSDIRQPEGPSETYTQTFERFLAPLRDHTFRKLVLSRSEVHPVGTDFSPIHTFLRACEAYPRMFIYLIHTPATGTWLGSTPEILLSGKGREWRTVALAGTMGLDEGEWSPKNREEQEMVAEYIRNVLRPHCSEVHEEGPYTARAGQLLHLKSEFTFTLRQRERLGDLLQALHPTPAVCGLPKDEARTFILAHEGYSRSYYSGFVGWLDPLGETHLYVNLRCLRWDGGPHVTLYAGGGLLPTSQCAKEWHETEEKMRTMKEVLIPPKKL